MQTNLILRDVWKSGKLGKRRGLSFSLALFHCLRPIIEATGSFEVKYLLPWSMQVDAKFVHFWRSKTALIRFECLHIHHTVDVEDGNRDYSCAHRGLEVRFGRGFISVYVPVRVRLCCGGRWATELAWRKTTKAHT